MRSMRTWMGVLVCAACVPGASQGLQAPEPDGAGLAKTWVYDTPDEGSTWYHCFTDVDGRCAVKGS